MSNGTNFFDDLIEERLADLHTAMPCRVEKYDEATGKADVTPLFKRKFKGQEAQEMPLLTGLPTLKRKRKVSDNPVSYEVYPLDLEHGDIVLVIFAERALDNALTGSPVDPAHSRKHALKDGIVIGLL